MTRKLDALPGGKIREDVFAGLLQLALDLGNFLLEADSQRMRLLMLAQIIVLALQLDNRLLEIKIMFHRGTSLRLRLGWTDYCARMKISARGPLVRVISSSRIIADKVTGLPALSVTVIS